MKFLRILNFLVHQCDLLTVLQWLVGRVHNLLTENAGILSDFSHVHNLCHLTVVK